MVNLIIFGILSIPVVMLSWRSLSGISNHGFYRFFSWECIVWLLAINYRYWFTDPFSLPQIVSWVLLIYGGYLAVIGLRTFLRNGKIDTSRDEKALMDFEKTTRLIDQGIYSYIRHPLYATLIYLTWGIFFKHMTVSLFIVSLVSTLFLYITSRFDEKECLAYFGSAYRDYMKRSKMFIPFVF
jgi:protein-S-isoprenylcysteine O-methyltransferase Ste14